MFKRLCEFRIVPQVNVTRINDGLRVAEALIKAKLPVMEIKFKKHSDSKIIKAIVKEFPDFWIGVGGILNRDLLLRAIDAHVKFALAPGVNVETIEEAFKQDIQFAPGICTPSDIENALLLGCVNFQFFPAEQSGGTAMLNALMEPFIHLGIQFVPNGGITLENMNDYLLIPQVAGVTAKWIADDEIINSKKWKTITDNAVKTLKQASKLIESGKKS